MNEEDDEWFENIYYWVCLFRPGRFPGIAGNTGKHGKDGKFHKGE